MANYIIGHYFY